MIRYLLLSFILGTTNAASYSCSSQNTGSTFASIYNMYQSAGACTGTCSGYSFAILQGFNCYCSNFAPAATVANSRCDTECPGFPSDICGGSSNGVFAYYQLAQASGTLSLSVSSSSPTASSVSSSSASTITLGPGNVASSDDTTQTTPDAVTQTITQLATPTSSTLRTSSTSRTSSSSSRSSTTSLATGIAEQQNSSTGSSFFDSAGKVAGTFVAVGLVALALIGALIFFCCRRRRQERSSSSTAFARKETPESTLDGFNSDGPRRSGSTSKLLGYGAAGTGAAALAGIATREKQTNPPSNIAWPRPHERAEIVPVDQRLNPRPMLMRFDSNYSRHSLRDDEDYSRRVLTVANPDTIH